MTAVPGNRQQAYTLSDKDFQFVCRFVYEHTGIVLDERKREMVYRRLMRRTRHLKLSSFGDYCEILKAGNDEGELKQFINAITTNLTSFFRENHHFQYLESNFLPEVMKEVRQRRLRIWSAGCSTGEEPYSIAITLQRAFATVLPNWDAKILATDLDTDVLTKANSGIYGIDRVSDIPEDIKKKWFRKGTGAQARAVQVNPHLRKLITFKQLNLLGEWPMKGPFDIIFCRNVVIYFDKNTQHELIDRYYQLLKPGGLLIMGHSENLGAHAKRFELIGKTIFKKPGSIA
jgi:chemotaxis protein methyltransferase CheR